MRKIIVGTRGSKLALIQTNWVIKELKKAGIENDFEIRKIETKGDRVLDKALSEVGGSNIFTKELEQAMYDQEIDFAVHSMKDLPAAEPEGLVIAAIPKREDARDAYLAKDPVTLGDLPVGAIVGTSSLRRAAQLLAVRPDLETKWIRGPIDSRISQLKQGDFDAIILAVAGLKRLGEAEHITEYLPADPFIPSAGQGALAIECRADDEELRMILAAIHHEADGKTVTAERTFMNVLQGDDQSPLAAHAEADGENIVLHAAVLSTDGKKVLKETIRGKDPKLVGTEAAEKLIGRGANEIIEAVKASFDRQ
jgi:hydroxymethylbilane synthase